MSQSAIGIGLSPPHAATDARRPVSFVSSAKLISALTLVSRILGMARESVMATYFGAGVVSSAFTVAFKVPNLFRKLLGEGALSSAFIPLYAQAIKTGNMDEANRFAAASVNLLVTILLGLTVVGEAGLWLAARFIHFRPEDLLAVKFTAIMLPYVMLICGTAFLGAILQVHKRFGFPAAAPVLLNVIHIAVIMIGARWLMLSRANEAFRLALQIRLAYWLAAFVLVAGVLQIAMLLPALRAVGFRFVWVVHFWTPAVRRMLRMSIPVALSAGVLQLSVVLDTGLTVLLTRGQNPADKLHLFGYVLNYPMALGAVARLYWAQMLYQFPLGVFAIAVATAIFPGLSVSAHDQDQEKFKRVLRQGIIFTLLEGIPAGVGLILVRYPAIRLMFQRGNFTAQDTQWVALSTIFYAAGLWAFSLQQILNRAYYALHDMTTPLVLSVATLVLNTVVEIPLSFTRLGEAGMAAGTLVSFAMQAIVMLILLDRKAGGLGMKFILLSTAKMLAACGLMVIACLAIQRSPIFPHGTNTLASIAQLMILMLVGGTVYGCVCLASGLRAAME
ncbi:MAG: murein biosynthesis integral membrane protein MurJ [Planctomycetota bacterium]|nr:murein biosynthesis integral membrane protein MurJ [Planctomycetota bacterium]